MSEFKQIMGYFLPDSTVKPSILEVIYYDNDSVVTSPMNTTEVFQIQIRFSKQMNPTVDPTFTLVSTGSKNPVVPGGGVWSNIVESGDGYLSPYFALSGDYIGTITVGVSGGISFDGNVMDNNNAVDLFTLQAADGPTENSVVINEGTEYVNNPEVDLKLGSTNAAQMWISGDVANDVNTNDWINYAEDLTVQLASGDDGTKNIYAKYKTASGDESSFVADRIVLDRSGDAITDIACSNGSGGASIGNADWQIVNKPYFSWTEPVSTAPIQGYAYVLTSGDGSDSELPSEINLFDNFLNYDDRETVIPPGKHLFIVKAQDKAGNWGSGDQFDLWVASGDNFQMARVRAYTSGDKLTEIENGIATSSGDSRVYIEWQDPSSPGNDVFYIQHSGDNVNENDFSFSTSDPNYKFTDPLGVGITRILVRAITGLGVSGDISEFNLIWASGDIT